MKRVLATACSFAVVLPAINAIWTRCSQVCQKSFVVNNAEETLVLHIPNVVFSVEKCYKMNNRLADSAIRNVFYSIFLHHP